MALKCESLAQVRLIAAVLAVVLVGGVRPDMASAVVYTNVTASAGINHVQYSGGVTGSTASFVFRTGGAAAGDYDNDGWTDLFVTRLNARPLLYRNLGNGTFQNVGPTAGFTNILAANAPAWGDVDNDGDQDLYITSSGDTRFYLYINDGRDINGNVRFTEQAIQRGAAVDGAIRYAQSVTFGDYDQDGYLDIHTTDWGYDILTSPGASRLLRNLGAANPGHFEDKTAEAGLNVYRPSRFYGGGTDSYAYRHTSTFTDIDRDGDPDLAIAGDFMTSQLFWNNGDGTFTDGTLAAGVGTDEDGMGTTVGDFDGDGQLDWFITALVDVPGQIADHSGNRLYRNNGDRTFADQTDLAGVRDSGWSWGTTFLDHDNDRDLDLFITNGWPPQTQFADKSHIYQNDNGVFTDVSAAAGVTDNGQGRGLLSLDYDNDGDLDVFIVNNGNAQPILYRNDGGNANDWLKIKVEGTASNRNGIGALITVTPDLDFPEKIIVREISAGSNFLSQNDLTGHFGLGPNSGTIDLITVAWPSGSMQTLRNIPANQVLNLVELVVMPGDYNGDSVVDAADYTVWRDQLGSAGSGFAADGNGDHLVTELDYDLWKVHFGETAAGLASLAESQSVPEPSTGLLWWIGLTAISLARRASRRKLYVLLAIATLSTPLATEAAGRQMSLAPIDLLPNAPTTYQLRDWHATATDFDILAFDTTASGQFLPLVRIDDTPVSPQLQKSFGLAAYVGETRVFGETGEPVHEAIASLGAVLGGTLVGIDKSAGPNNWVAMSREYYVDRNSQFVVLNTPFSSSGQSAWYETYPSILYYAIADRYPGEATLQTALSTVDTRFYSAVNKLTAGGTAPNFYYTAFNFKTQQPVYNGQWREPDMGLGMAWLQHAAYWRHRESNPAQATTHLDAVQWALAAYEQISSNPDYEILTPFGAYAAARMNAEHGGNYDVHKLVKWVFDRSSARPTKIMISGEQWGGQDVGGLMGFTIPNTGSDVRGYAFSMNTFATAMPMVPLVRYEDRYSRAIGKWMLNAASAARLFYADAHSLQNQSSEFWAGDPQHSVAYEGLRHHWLSANDSEELFAGGDPLTYGWGPQTDFSIYGSAVSGVFGAIIKTTNVEKILQLDLLAADFYRDTAHSTYLYYNPHGTAQSVAINLASGSSFDLYDAVSNRYLARGATAQTYFNVPPDDAVMLVLVPAGGTETRAGRQLLVDGVVIDHSATLLPENLVRNPDIDTAISNNPNRPAFWHYSSQATWSDDEALSPTHSLALVDNRTTAAEEWRSYATNVPAGADRAFQLRWFWKHDIAAGSEFRARLRLSNDAVTSLDLTNPSSELNFTVSGQAGEFEMFETTIELPDGVRSFDLTFISGGPLSALGTIYIDDISAAIVTAPLLVGDYNSNGVVDAADYVVWRESLGSAGAGLAADGNRDNMVTSIDYEVWKANFGISSGSASSSASAFSVPESTSACFVLVSVACTVYFQRTGQR
jgi:hypothetical protein